MLAGIGNTPVVRLIRLVEPGMAEVWVKLEAANPTGSYKDRMALAMIEGAERAGRLAPGQPVVEYTGGSTGSSLAFVCAVTGYPLHIVTSDAFAEEKRRTMEAFGAHARGAAESRGHHARADPADAGTSREVAASSAATRPTSSRTPTWSTATGGSATSSLEQLPGPIDALCAYVGTAGCFLGVGQALRGPTPSCSGSPSSRPSPPCCPAGRRARTASRVAASGFFPTCSPPTTSTT